MLLVSSINNTTHTTHIFYKLNQSESGGVYYTPPTDQRLDRRFDFSSSCQDIIIPSVNLYSVNALWLSHYAMLQWHIMHVYVNVKTQQRQCVNLYPYRIGVLKWLINKPIMQIVLWVFK
jgi:hypothetical protein